VEKEEAQQIKFSLSYFWV